MTSRPSSAASQTPGSPAPPAPGPRRSKSSQPPSVHDCVNTLRMPLLKSITTRSASWRSIGKCRQQPPRRQILRDHQPLRGFIHVHAIRKQLEPHNLARQPAARRRAPCGISDAVNRYSLPKPDFGMARRNRSATCRSGAIPAPSLAAGNRRPSHKRGKKKVKGNSQRPNRPGSPAMKSFHFRLDRMVLRPHPRVKNA